MLFLFPRPPGQVRVENRRDPPNIFGRITFRPHILEPNARLELFKEHLLQGMDVLDLALDERVFGN